MTPDDVLKSKCDQCDDGPPSIGDMLFIVGVIGLYIALSMVAFPTI